MLKNCGPFTFLNRRRIGMLLFLAACQGGVQAEVDLVDTYPIPDVQLGERIREGEVDAARRLIATLEEEVRSEYQPGNAKRDAHPKAHGCVAATFNVHDNLPPRFEHGVFQSGASYDALIRFSNGSPNASSKDISGDTRGMAIKLHGVQGEKLFSPKGQEDVQDLILISSPVFFINDAEGYAEFFEIVDRGSKVGLLKIPFILGVRGSYQAYKMLSQTIANPVTTRYWSVVPYQLGLGNERRAVKYSAKPCDSSKANADIPKNPSDNYLRQALVDTLADTSACMEFMVQERTGDLSVENALLEWDESEAPFHTVADIKIHQQTFDTHEQNQMCESQSYNPWHALPEHKPLGMVNRLRRVVYEAISELRHSMNRAN